MASILINLFLFLATGIVVMTYFRKDGAWNRQNGLRSFRFFTTLSNVLVALAGLAVFLCEISGAAPDALPLGIWIFKYLGTTAVAVTLLTVVFFLGPTMGYKEMFAGSGLYVHLIGPLLAIFSFRFLETKEMYSFATSLLGMIPMTLYGIVYLIMVVFLPEEKGWDDFYGFNRGGKWMISFAAMLIGTFLICVILRIL